MIHINDINNFNICKHLYVKSQTSTYTNTHHFINMDETLSIIAIKKLNITNAFFGQKNDNNQISIQAMNDNDWLIKPRFEYEELRVKIPIMHRVNDKWDVYFLRNELYPKEDNIQYIADNMWVLNKLSITVNNVMIMHFNANYVREENIDYQKLMVITERVYNHNNHPSKIINESIKNKTRDLSLIIKAIRDFDVTKLKAPRREKKCTRRYKCRFYDDCFSEESLMPDNSILTLVGSENKYKMKEKGIDFLAQADLDQIEGTRQQYAQIMADRNGGLFVDKLNLSLWLKDQIIRPISFLDFEWDRYAVPPYINMKPFDVLLFQYSLHILDDELTHKEYIGVEDCRKEFIESLLANLPKTGSIVVFNASGGEQLRLQELKQYFPEYEKQIDDVIDRIIDISIPFNLGMLYHIKMRGYYSLKKIIEAIDERLSYHNLGISQAMSAVDTYRLLDGQKNNDNKDKLIKDLLAYCAMDTYSLYQIYKWFIEITNQKEESCQV
ncbi:MAG: DUF2779 domain-containing protein [Erysipelotrichaceae bacterium]|nr:DUF2779 domain-containing protein [Erysipelotrichaceae bacterium]MDD3924024.1 DUF2779 domain-containing protein [Erysipelotrichaceae bacterium]